MAKFHNYLLSYPPLLVLWLSFQPFVECFQTMTDGESGVYVDGDIVIGGLIPVHFAPSTVQHASTTNCRGAFHVRGYKGVQAMMYAIESINNNSNLLPNITLGIDIKDSCGSVDHSIMQCLEFDFIRNHYLASQEELCPPEKRERINNKSFDEMNTTLSKNKDSSTQLQRGCCILRKSRTVAIVGAAFSGVTMAIANLAGLFHVPVISYSSTSRLLSDRDRFKSFYRTVSSDELQARAMVDILHALQWQLVVTAASNNEYGRSGINALKQIIHTDNRRKICIVVDVMFSRRGETRTSKMKRFFEKVKNHPKSKVIILFAEFPDANYFMNEATAAGLKDYVFLGSDSWTGSSKVVSGHDQLINAVIGLKPLTVRVTPFSQYIEQKIRKNASKADRWTKEYKQQLNCSSKYVKTCSLYNNIHSLGYVSYIIDAVLAVAHALHNMFRCTQTGCPVTWQNVNFQHFNQFLKNVTFTGFLGENISFDKTGSINAGYSIYTLTNNSYKYVRIGMWKQNALEFNQSKIFWKNNSAGAVSSVCSYECMRGYYKTPHNSFPECCWDCLKCRGKTITNKTGLTSCIECPVGTWPNGLHNACLPIHPTYLNWTEVWGIVILAVSSSGVLAISFTLVVFCQYRHTAIVKAASHHLCFVLLTGIAMFFATPAVYVAKPTPSSCRSLPFLFGMCFVLVVGTILVKTNRISRIFNEKLLQTGQASFLDNRWQMLLTGTLVVIELAVTFGWVYGNSTPHPRVIYHESTKEAFLLCDLSASEVGFSVWLIYNAGMVLVCTYQAFLVRKVPQNYNESKFIAFTMMTICITVIVYIPSYMGTTGWYRTVLSCFMFFFIGSISWVCIFVPKLYIILFRPHKNIAMRPSINSMTLGVFTQAKTCNDGLDGTVIWSRTSSETSCATGCINISFDDDDWTSDLSVRTPSVNSICKDSIFNEEQSAQRITFVGFGENILNFSELQCNSPASFYSDNVDLNSNRDEQIWFEPQNSTQEFNEEEKIPLEKKTSVVRFEDEVIETITPKKIVRRHSDIPSSGILKRTSYVGEHKINRDRNRFSMNGFFTGMEYCERERDDDIKPSIERLPSAQMKVSGSNEVNSCQIAKRNCNKTKIEAKSLERKISVVHFEDEVIETSKPKKIVRRHSDTSSGGILKKASHVGENRIKRNENGQVLHEWILYQNEVL